jgi:hypothetical protein
MYMWVGASLILVKLDLVTKKWCSKNGVHHYKQGVCGIDLEFVGFNHYY